MDYELISGTSQTTRDNLILYERAGLALTPYNLKLLKI